MSDCVTTSISSGSLRTTFSRTAWAVRIIRGIVPSSWARDVRFMQLHSPFSRGFHARRDNQLTFGPELGVRFPVGRDQRFLPFASLGMSFFPSETSSLPPLITLNLGLGYGVLMDR